MRHLVALMLLLATTAGGAEQDGSFSSSAGSEDIYFQQPSQYDNGSDYYYYDDDVDEVEEEHVQPGLEEEQAAKPSSDNIEGIGENEVSCELSCPRYYRPVCVRRNGELITYATPCEYHNRLRCANVARRLGRTDTPTYELVYYNPCRQKRK